MVLRQLQGLAGQLSQSWEYVKDGMDPPKPAQILRASSVAQGPGGTGRGFD